MWLLNVKKDLAFKKISKTLSTFTKMKNKLEKWKESMKEIRSENEVTIKEIQETNKQLSAEIEKTDEVINNISKLLGE